LLNRRDRFKIIFFFSHIKELKSASDIGIEISQGGNDAIKQFLFLA
jgi:hypothetical protein